MDCNLARRLLPYDRPGGSDLDAADRAALGHHLESCPGCAAAGRAEQRGGRRVLPGDVRRARRAAPEALHVAKARREREGVARTLLGVLRQRGGEQRLQLPRDLDEPRDRRRGPVQVRRPDALRVALVVERTATGDGLVQDEASRVHVTLP